MGGDLNEKINWKDAKSHLLLNPRMPELERQQLEELFHHYARPGHIWIASSGSSKKTNESVKLIALSKDAFLASSQAVNEHLSVSSQDRWIQILPRFHVGGLSLESRAFLSGIEVGNGLIHESQWEPKYFIEQVQQQKATLTSMVPTQVFDLIQAKISCPSSLRAIVVGGAAMSQELYSQARKFGWPVLPSFGMTECASQIATAELKSLDGFNFESLFPLYKVLNHCKAELTEDGFLKLKCASLFTGFAQFVDGESKWVEASSSKDLITQDRAEIHRTPDGVFLKGMSRDSDFIKIKGEGVSLSKLREVLDGVLGKSFPESALDCALVAFEGDSRDGANLVLIYSKLVTESQAQSIREAFNKKVSPVERIVLLTQVAQIPRSPLGKILYSEMSCTKLP